MSARDLTAADLIRSLGAVTARPAVDNAVRVRAEAAAREISRRAGEADDVALRRIGPADYAVDVSGPGLFAREYGRADGTAEPVVAPAIDALKAKP